MKRKWKRVRDGVYELRDGDKVLVTIEREDSQNSSGISIWQLVGQRRHFTTLRDAKRFAEASVT